ncbi:MAG TPA: aminotransferase class V-fold PLP-dependent enzyme [Bryobacteraceae bacterium]|nr:aminotransferase class V-fold PLP-dependent enzyme [Bryobacteraceae bacterium]
MSDDEAMEGRLFLEAASRGAAYLRDIRRRSVAPSGEAVARLDKLGGPMPSESMDPAEVLRLLDEIGSPATVANSGARYFGFVNGGALPVARAANVLAAAWDQNASLRVMSPVAAELENIALRWLLELLGLPAEAGGAFVTGATMANLCGLAAARHALLERSGWDVEADGLFGAPPLTVVVGEEVHVSALKALALLGLGKSRVVTVETDHQGRMRMDRMPRLDASTIVCTQAGNVNTGALDPFAEICAAANEAGAWVHVDGAFGLWAAASGIHSDLVRGLSDAHSWATDAHKWLNVPYDCGLAFVRDAEALRRSMHMQAAYLISDAGRDPMQWTPESSRRARGVEVWAALRQLGKHGLAEMIRRSCAQAKRFASGLQKAGHTVWNEVALNQALVSFKTDAHTRAVVEGVQRDGTCWCGGTVWKGHAAMRISVSSWATTDEDVDRSLAAILRVADRCAGS